MSDTTVVYEKCPQKVCPVARMLQCLTVKMLKFYESHLVFRTEDPQLEEKPNMLGLGH
jgi:hypothetical protein